MGFKEFLVEDLPYVTVAQNSVQRHILVQTVLKFKFL